MNRRLSAFVLSALGAGALLAAPDGGNRQAVAADAEAVDAYLARLSETVPRPAMARLAETPVPEDPKLAKETARIDRVEPVANAVLSAVR